jgi:antitoxin component YwqK of YwqJK toxin-antitoxin module
VKINFAFFRFKPLKDSNPLEIFSNDEHPENSSFIRLNNFTKQLKTPNMKKIALIAFLLLTITSVYSQSLEYSEGYYYKNGMLYTGTYTEYWPNKNVKLVQNISNGLEDGISELNFENGKLQEQRSYQDGQKHGIWYTYNESGVKIAEANYRHNKKDGIWRIWDESGKIRYEMYYSNGEKTGTWRIWDEMGNLTNERNYSVN